MSTLKYCPVCGFVACYGQFDSCIDCGSNLIDSQKSLNQYYLELDTNDPREVQEYVRNKYIYNNDLFDVNKENKRLKSSLELQKHIEENTRKQENQTEINLPCCPTCGSTNVEKISGVNKVGSVVLFGIFSLGHVSKTFKCKNCGMKF